ncbi:MAG: hypothetical protein ACRDQ5_09565 [Sciscionella sp.]
MTSAAAQRRSVLLLHDQLQDAQVFGKLASTVEEYATAHTVRVPPLPEFGAPAWADHIGGHARKAVVDGTVPRPVDLVVTVGHAGEAGIALVADDYARAALLINPDTMVLGDDVAPGEQSKDTSERVRMYFLGIGVYAESATGGRMSRDGVETLVVAALEKVDRLTDADRKLVRRVAVEQMCATMPLRKEQLQRRSTHDTSWIEQAKLIAGRCSVALSASGGRQDQLRKALRRTAPEVDVLMLHSASWYVWLSSPETVSTVIHDLLA